MASVQRDPPKGVHGPERKRGAARTNRAARPKSSGQRDLDFFAGRPSSANRSSSPTLAFFFFA